MNRLEIFEAVYGKVEWSESALLHLMRVADLVAAAEREECAALCEENVYRHVEREMKIVAEDAWDDEEEKTQAEYTVKAAGWMMIQCAKAIRARGNQSTQQDADSLVGLRGCNSKHGGRGAADPCIYRMRTTDPDCTGCAERDEGFGSRDPDCPACKILIEAATGHDAMERRLRDAEARVAELEAERAEREKQEPIATVGWDRNFMGVVWHGKDMPEKGVETLLYAAPPVTAPVRLTDKWIMEMAADGGFLASVKEITREIETAVLRANGFDIQPPRGEG